MAISKDLCNIIKTRRKGFLNFSTNRLRFPDKLKYKIPEQCNKRGEALSLRQA